MGLFTESWSSSGHIFLVRSNPIQLGDRGRIHLEVHFSDKEHAIGIDKANRFGYYLSLMVRSLTLGSTGAEVRVNNKRVGEIHTYPGEDHQHWYTQTLILENVKDEKMNEIEIVSAPNPNARPNERFDDILIKNMILHYNISYQD
ncbi:MAG: hypothetical protein AAF223_13205 [Bacteroidota bacterium]